MKITRNNYEPWFLDYLEGNLNREMVDEFIEFIRQNPDLREELRLFEPRILEGEPVYFEGKEKLYKELFDIPSEFDNAAIGLLEGDLKPEQELMFRNFLLLHPEKHSELELFRQTKLNPDFSLVYRLKQQMYHQPVFRQLMDWSVRVAALLFLVLIISTLTDQPGRNPGKELTTFRVPYASESKVPANEISVENNSENGRLISTSGYNSKPQISKNTSGKEYREKVPSLTEDNSAVSTITRIETPALISPIAGVPEPVSPQFALAEMKTFQNLGYSAGVEPDVLPLSDKLIEKIGLKDFKLNKLVRSGLDLAVKITNDKFSYTQDKSGNVTAYHLDTRVLGFSVPVGSRKEQLALQ